MALVRFFPAETVTASQDDDQNADSSVQATDTRDGRRAHPSRLRKDERARDVVVEGRFDHANRKLAQLLGCWTPEFVSVQSVPIGDNVFAHLAIAIDEEARLKHALPNPALPTVYGPAIVFSYISLPDVDDVVTIDYDYALKRPISEALAAFTEYDRARMRSPPDYKEIAELRFAIDRVGLDAKILRPDGASPRNSPQTSTHDAVVHVEAAPRSSARRASFFDKAFACFMPADMSKVDGGQCAARV
jgi:hypothetical protein